MSEPSTLVTPTAESRSHAPVISAHDLTRFYGQVLGLNGIDLEIGPGITGLLGPNGAGKSTLLWMIAGQLRPSRGTLTVYGQPVPGGAALRRKIGLCPEPDAFYWEMTGEGFVRACARLSGLSADQARKRTDEVLELLKLTGVMGRAVRTYSRGERGRLKLAQALVADPQLLLLDEPLAGTDPVGRSEIIALIRSLARQGKDILVSSHVLDEIEALTDTVVLLFRGRVVADGKIPAIREVLDEHPHRVVIVCDAPRRLAQTCIQFDDVVSCQTDRADVLEVRTRRPALFYARLPKLLVEGNHHVREIRTADDSLEAVFEYLVGKQS